MARINLMHLKPLEQILLIIIGFAFLPFSGPLVMGILNQQVPMLNIAGLTWGAIVGLAALVFAYAIYEGWV